MPCDPYICPVHRAYIFIYALCTGLYTGVFFFGRYCSVNLRFWNSYIALSFYQFSVFSEWPILILDRILELSYWIVLIAEREKKWHIYYIYGVLSGYIQRYSRLNLGFFRPRQKNSLGQGRALGNFLASDEKKPRFRGYIVVYSPPGPHIIHYINIYIYIYIWTNTTMFNRLLSLK